MSEPTKEELLAFMRKHGPENVDCITDTESAIRHFRCTSKIYKEQRDQYKAERDKFEKMLNKECECGFQMEGKYRDMKQENEKLERENEKQLDLLQDFSKFINYKLEVSPASDTYKRYRSELDKLGVK